MPQTRAPRNFEVIGLRRRGFSTTRSPAVGSVVLGGSQPALQLTTETGPQPVTGLPFVESFESGGRGNWQTNVGMQFTQTERYNGLWSSYITAQAGVGSDKYLEYNFADHPSVGGIAVGQRDLYLRFAHKWSSNWNDGGYGGLQKLMLLNLHNPASGQRRYQLTFNLWTPDGGYFCEFLRITEQGAFNGSATPNVGIGLTRVLGVWVEFVFRIRMNTPGVQDGILQIWSKSEGESSYTLRVNRLNINYRDSTTFSPNRLIQSNYQPETVLSGSRYWDYWLLTEQPIDVDTPDSQGDWPSHAPGYVSVLPGVGGYGMNTPAGAGRDTGTTVIFVDSLNSGNSGTAIDASLSAALNWPTPSYRGTPEYAARHAASPKVILPITSGIATIQASIPNQTGTPPRPGLTTYYGQSAPNPGLILRGCNWALNGGSGHAIWHMKSWMGDDVAGLSAENRDCLSSGYAGGVTQQVVLINCEFQWSVDELVDFYRAHNQLTFVNCAFIEPLHDSTVEHAGDPTNTDHGFGPIIGGDVGSGQPSLVSTFRCVWAHTTSRNPFTNATTFVHANNLHYNHGRPAGVDADGNAVQIVSQAATDPMFANILANGFIRGPNNRGNLVAVSVSATLPPGSQGYAFGNAQFGWTSPSSQSGFFTSAPAGYVVGGLVDAAYPSSWGVGLTGVLQWAADPLAPTLAEWHAFIDKMERTAGASPRWRTPANSRLRLVFQQIRDRLNGVAQADQFIDTVAQAGGWPTIAQVTLNPLEANSTHWHAPLPTGLDRDTPYTSGTFSDGKSRIGYTRLEAWAYEQHLFVMQIDKLPPTVPSSPTATALSTSTIRIAWGASVDQGVSGLAGYRVYRSNSSTGTFAQIGADIAAGTTEYQDNTLGASTTRYYYIVAFDFAGNVSGASTIVSATTASNPSPGGDWADIYTTISGLPAGLSVDGRRVGIRGTSLADWGPFQTQGNGGQLIYRANQSFDGREPIIEFRPPTLIPQGYNTILGGPIHRNGLNNIKQINFRWLEWIGPRYWDMSASLRPKWSGFFISASPSVELNSNRVGIFDAPNGAGTVYPCVTAATVQTYNYPPDGYNADVGSNATKLIAIRGTTNHSLNAPQTGGGEWICFEQVVDCMQTRGNPFGRHELRVWTRDRAANGRLLRIPLNWDGGWNFQRQYIYSAEGLGAYFNGTATAHPDNYKLWSHCTMAANMGIDELIGPPSWFFLV